MVLYCSIQYPSFNYSFLWDVVTLGDMASSAGAAPVQEYVECPPNVALLDQALSANRSAQVGIKELIDNSIGASRPDVDSNIQVHCDLNARAPPSVQQYGPDNGTRPLVGKLVVSDNGTGISGQKEGLASWATVGRMDGVSGRCG